MLKLQNLKQNKMDLLPMRGSTSCLIDQRGRPWEGDKLGMTLLGLEPLVPREAPRLLVGVPKAAWTWSSSLALCSSPHSSAAGRKVPPGKDTSLIVSADRTLPHTHTHTKTLPKSDSFKSGWEGNPPLPLFFYQPYRAPGKICLRSLFGDVIAVCQLLARAICKLRISSLFC